MKSLFGLVMAALVSSAALAQEVPTHDKPLFKTAFAEYKLQPAPTQPVGGGRDDSKKTELNVAKEVETADSWSYTVVSRVLSQYLGLNGAVFHKKPVLQTSFTASHANGLYLDLWTSVGLADKRYGNNFGDEIDLTAGWAGSKFDIDWDVGLSYIIAGNMGHSDDDFWWQYIEGKKTFELGESQTLSPFGRVEWFANTELQPIKPYLEAGAYHSWQISESVSLQSRGSMLWDSGVFGFRSGFVARYKGSLDWKICENVTLEAPYVKLSHPFMDDDREDEIAAGVGFRIGF